MDTGKSERVRVLPADKFIYGETPKEAFQNAETVVATLKLANPGLYFNILA